MSGGFVLDYVSLQITFRIRVEKAAGNPLINGDFTQDIEVVQGVAATHDH